MKKDMKNTKWILISCGFAVLFIAITTFIGVKASPNYQILEPEAYLPLVLQQPTLTPTSIPPGVQILPNNSYYVDSIGYLHIVGEVLNNTGDHLRYVKITANIFNVSQLLDTEYTYIHLDNLPAWNKTCFNLTLPEPFGWLYYEFEPPTY